jgi:SpoVK/Ycf46/Vps4 family AAA+-type ATPase
LYYKYQIWKCFTNQMSKEEKKKPGRPPKTKTQELEPKLEETVQRETFVENLAELERSRVKIDPKELLEDDPFYDVIGYDDLKNFLKTAVDLPLKQPELYNIIGSYKGTLLYGPPGTGKTAFARATARMVMKQAEKQKIIVRFYTLNASNIKSRYIGVGESKIDDYFTIMRGVYDGNNTTPIKEEDQSKYFTVLFLDEIDAIAMDRDVKSNSDAADLVPVLLDKMDPAFPVGRGKLFILAATNQPASLDSAITRRLEQRFYIGLPEKDVRNKVFQKYLGVSNPNMYNSRRTFLDGMIKALVIVETQLKSKGYGDFFQRLALLSNSDIVTLVKSLFTARVEMALEGKWNVKNGGAKLSTDKNGIITKELPYNVLNVQSFEFVSDDDINNYATIAYKIIMNTKANVRMDELAKFLWFFLYNERPPKQHDSSVDIKSMAAKNQQPDSAELYSIFLIILKKITLTPYMIELKFDALKKMIAKKPNNLIQVLKKIHDAENEIELGQAIGNLPQETKRKRLNEEGEFIIEDTPSPLQMLASDLIKMDLE